MESAKAAVKDFMHRDGKHDTSVHETVAPAVTNETVNKHRHENVTTAVDREVHQDHHHTTVQPVHDTKTLPEKHHHNLVPVEHRKFEHGNDEDVSRRLETEKARFNDSTVQGDTKHTHSVQPIVGGEHVHHHVHETIQPVVNRQTVEPHVVHTTIPIHETHHSAAKHHETSALPAVSMADFKKQGGSLGGREQRNDFFEGEPRNGIGHEPYRDDASHEFRKTGHVDQHGAGVTGSHHTGSNHAGTGAAVGAAGAAAATHHHDGKTGEHHHGREAGAAGAGGAVGAAAASAMSGSHNNHGTTGTTGTTGSNLTGSNRDGLTGTSTGTGSGLTGSHHNNTTGSGLTGSNTGSSLTGNNTGLGNTSSTGTGLTGSHHNTTGTTDATGTYGKGPRDSLHDNTVDDTTTKKPSLLQRLNPMKDADGDGKKGFMD